ncbi:unnamed protein product [Brassica oleracea var. botrytis]
MRKWFLSCFMKSLQCIWPIHEKGSTIKKLFNDRRTFC